MESPEDLQPKRAKVSRRSDLETYLTSLMIQRSVLKNKQFHFYVGAASNNIAITQQSNLDYVDRIDTKRANEIAQINYSG
jgi:hypothetical protein